jgi:hypothetical protein
MISVFYVSRFTSKKIWLERNDGYVLEEYRLWKTVLKRHLKQDFKVLGLNTLVMIDLGDNGRIRKMWIEPWTKDELDWIHNSSSTSSKQFAWFLGENNES